MSAALIQILLIAISVAVNVYILFNFCNRMYNRVYQSKLPYINVFSFAWLLITALNLFGYTTANIVAYTLLLFGVGIIMYGAKKGSDILSMFLLLMFLFSIEVVGQFVISLIYSTPFSIPTGSLAQTIITFFSYEIIMRFVGEKKTTFQVESNWVTLVIVPGISLYLIFATLNLLNDNSTYAHVILAATASILIFVMNIAVFFLFRRNALLYKQNEQSKMMEQQRQLQFRYYNELEQKYESYRKLYHDIKNHLNTLERLYETSSPATQEYSQTLHEKLDAIYFPQTTNRILNVLFSDRQSFAQSHNISFDVSCEEIDLEFISDFDLTTIIANLLDNAFDECIGNNLSENKIEIKICQINRFIVFLIRNTCKTAPQKNGSHFTSNKAGHMGLGMLNVQEIVQNKYCGTFNADYKDGMFTVQITFAGQDDTL